MIPVKICGITSRKDAKHVASMGVSAIGFIFYKKSPRYISANKAREIVKEFPSEISIVGVFVNSDPESIHQIAETVGLDFIQLHGDESPDFCRLISLPVIKAIRITNLSSMSNYRSYRVHSFLLDTYKSDIFGGTGETFDWSVVRNKKTETPKILSGGLTALNVLQGIEVVNPDAIDINSGVELFPGRKDPGKLKELFRILEETGEYPNIFNLFSN